MVFNHTGDKARLRRHRTNEAIALAMQSRWEEAVAVNKSIIEAFPDDADAFNRLGKALTQLGMYTEAREAYGHALEVEPNNAISRKNFDRLSHLKDDGAQPKGRKGVTSHLFIEETGKADAAELDRLADKDVLARMAAGDPVDLKPEGQRLLVESPDGEYLGEVEPRLGLRLIKLMEGGNEYAAAIASIGEDRGRVMIKEVFQHPSQAGRTSFPVRAPDEFRSYVRGSVLKYELEDDEDAADDDPSEEWGTGEPQRKQAPGAAEPVAFAEDEEVEDDGIEEG
jgi:tetratricopeptide (TPR) repeat protein